MENKNDAYKMFKIIRLIAFVFLCSIFLYAIVSNYISRDKASESIDILNKNTIERIRIDSVPRNHSIMQVPLIITNKDSIEKIIGYIKRAEDYRISHPDVRWVQHVVIESKNNDLILNVYGSSMNGTFIEIVTAEGEVLKTIRSDSLGIYFNGGKTYSVK